MKTIYKYAVPLGSGTFDHSIPDGAEFLNAFVQHGEVCMWFLVDPNAAQNMRQFIIFGTGHSIPEVNTLKHLSTFPMQEGVFIWHLFEEIWGTPE